MARLALAPYLAKPTRYSASRSCIALPRARSYYSQHHPSPPPFSDPHEKILAAAMRHVPAYGFSSKALTEGAKEVGYLEASVQLFPRAVFQLIQYHLVTQRLALKERVQFPEQTRLGLSQKVRTLTVQRLRANESIIHQWRGALTHVAALSNLPTALKELHALSDEICYLAGDTSVDSSWYTKRASLAALYASSELFMTTDTSTNFAATEEFVDKRLTQLHQAGSVIGGLGRYAGFWAGNSLNLARSWGMRI